MKSETAKGAGGESSPAKPMITPAEPVDVAASGTPARVRAKPVTARPSRVYAVELPSFEGPLDLLLHLVRRHELDILDIPIAFVTEKYLEYLSIMRALDIEILGDYLVMAATLAYLKSRELVPQQEADEEGSEEDDEDGEDPREALIRRLIEYERFRAAGRELNEMPVIGRDVFARGGSIDLPPLDPGMAPVTLFRLTEAYSRVLQRAQINKSHEVQLERVTIRQRMEQLSLLLDQRESVDFESLFLEQEWGSVEELRQMLVVTLMSVLELVKLGIIGVRQVHDSESIHLQKRASHAQAMRALSSYSEDDSFGEGGGEAGGGTPVTPEREAPTVVDAPSGGVTGAEAEASPDLGASEGAPSAELDPPVADGDGPAQTQARTQSQNQTQNRTQNQNQTQNRTQNLEEAEPVVPGASTPTRTPQTEAEPVAGASTQPRGGEMETETETETETEFTDPRAPMSTRISESEPESAPTPGLTAELETEPPAMNGPAEALRAELGGAPVDTSTAWAEGVSGSAPEDTLGARAGEIGGGASSGMSAELHLGTREAPTEASEGPDDAPLPDDDEPPPEPVDGALGDITLDALGAMLARVRRLEAEEEGSDASLREVDGDGAGEAPGEHGLEPSGEPSVDPSIGGPVELLGAREDREGREGREEEAEGGGRPGLDPWEGHEEGASEPAKWSEEQGAVPDRALGDLEEGEGGTTFIDAVDDSGESHE